MMMLERLCLNFRNSRKINNISSELEKVAELIGNIELLHKLHEIPAKTLKYVATNQSLYI